MRYLLAILLLCSALHAEDALKIKSFAIGSVGFGTAFPISSHQVLTASHVVLDDKDPPILFFLEVGGKWVPATLDRADRTKGLALLTTEAELKPVDLAPANAVVEPGDELRVEGFPMMLRKTMKATFFSVFYEEASWAQRITSEDFNIGASGSAVFDKLNRVIGVGYAILKDDKERYVLIVPIRAIHEFLAPSK